MKINENWIVLELTVSIYFTAAIDYLSIRISYYIESKKSKLTQISINEIHFPRSSVFNNALGTCLQCLQKFIICDAKYENYFPGFS